MIEIGTLVRGEGGYLDVVMGIVTGHWTHEESGEEHVLVLWLEGLYEGETDVMLPETLEVIA